MKLQDNCKKKFNILVLVRNQCLTICNTTTVILQLDLASKHLLQKKLKKE